MPIADPFHPPIPDQAGKCCLWGHLHGASVGLAISHALLSRTQPMLIIAPDSLYASHLIDTLHFFSSEQLALLEFPDWETLPYDHFSPHQDIISDRLTVLHQLPHIKQGAIITTLSTLLHRLPPKDYLHAHRFILNKGDTLKIDSLRAQLVSAGYFSVGQVREHGEFAIRGSLIDIYPMGSKQPFRIDLFDDEIDSIRLFAPDTQRSLERVDRIHLLPAKEFPLTAAAIEHFRDAWRSHFSGNPVRCPTYQDISEGICSPGIEYYLPLFFDHTATLFDYLPDNLLITTIGDTEAKLAECWRDVEIRYEHGRHDTLRPLLAPDQLFLTKTEVNEALKKHPRIKINPINKQHLHDFATKPAPALDMDRKASQPLASLQAFLTQTTGKILFSAESMGRREAVLQMLSHISLSPTYFPTWQAFLTSDETVGMVVTPIEEGFCLASPELALITETQLYGKRVMQRRLLKKSAQNTDALVRDLTELQMGDPVVHIDHGVGRYLGLETLTVSGQAGEFLALAYQGGDKLYVPVAALYLVSRYTGANPEQTPLNKLGTDHWQKAKRRAALKIRDVAAELLELYAKRAACPGHAYLLPEDQYAVFANAFPFEETPDQQQAIHQVIADMASDKPMDRVICGDVGFGKTEVAMRAAFLAVQNNRQVAVLVPTTLLAQQHYQNFQDRFADWPIQVELLSRFKTAKEQRASLIHMETGTADIVIGTHKLLQGGIQFKNLGLIIIDEEHRFGVRQKEKLKALRATADILTLTATPIPRTLNMALAGVRDLSIIATPPLRRLSVKTFVHDYQNQIIQEAIQREVMRGGQVYFLHNDISTIAQKAEEIAQLVPEARPTIAHGQMHERELERIMAGFYHRQSNVLVCSTIIESGIDIPTANTIIINRADKFGIAQLHQLRGRVGRSHHQAYAYLLIPSRQSVSRDAIKRLDAIAAFDDLGIGFTLSTHDLEIRGAGELLGEEQSGDMQEIGFTLYMELLSRAVESLKTGKEPSDDTALLYHGAEINLHIPAFIPDNYLADVPLRLQFYKRISHAKLPSELDDIQVEMIDRFGLLPPSLKNVFAMAELTLQANTLGITKLDAHENGGKLEFNDKPDIKPEKIIHLIQTASNRYQLEGPKRLKFKFEPHAPDKRIELVQTLLEVLAT